MRRSDAMIIRHAEAGAILARRWSFASDAACNGSAEAWSTHIRPEAGLLRASLYRGLEEPTLLELSHWSDAPTRDRYVSKGVDTANAGARDAGVEAKREWQHACDAPHGAYVRPNAPTAHDLVLVRQPLVRADPALGQEWIDLVLAALQGQAPEGLCAATFFVPTDPVAALNLAEWTSADAHRAALKTANFGQYGSIGDTPSWRRARSFPGITADHEVKRYTLFTALEP
jgi:hypothetical protein